MTNQRSGYRPQQPLVDSKPKSAIERDLFEDDQNYFPNEPLFDEEPQDSAPDHGSVSSTAAPSKFVTTVTSDGEVKETGLVSSPAVFDPADLSRLVEASKNLEKAQVGMSLTPQYYEFARQGDKTRGIYAGKTTIHKRNQHNSAILDPIECVLWISNGESFMNGGKALVSKFGTILAGTPVEIEYTGKQGDVKLFNVRLLNL
jgi:hypothetical protein